MTATPDAADVRTKPRRTWRGRTPGAAAYAKLRAQGAVEHAEPSRSWFMRWVACYIVSLACIGLVASVQQHLTTPFVFAAFAAPAVATLIMRRAARRAWWRFPAVWILSQVTVSTAAIVVLLVAQAWVLHQCWVVESDPRDRHFPNPLRGRNPLRAFLRHTVTSRKPRPAVSVQKKAAGASTPEASGYSAGTGRSRPARSKNADPAKSRKAARRRETLARRPRRS